jgi:hypothetical protein
MSSGSGPFSDAMPFEDLIEGCRFIPFGKWNICRNHSLQEEENFLL